jgi:glycosyl hydrolase family 38/alpha mannosidase-like protein
VTTTSAGSSEGSPATSRTATGRRRMAIVPHTHWDREWYEPFQTFRFELVRLVDDLLDTMERDSAFRAFLLDGQLAVVDDYLEIRPHSEGRLRELAAAGRISVGPWYILMDEFLVSGETIIRNLQAGVRRATAFGGPMEVGYLPDMFGHVAQMPQILRQAGFRHAVVWRGVPSAVDRTAFVWRAPDGSAVRAEYLVAGYGNGAALPDDAKGLVRRLRSLVEEFGPFLDDDQPVLVMNGTDHQHPQPWLGRVVAEVNDLQSEMDLEITSLAEYLDGAPSDRLPTWEGELRSGWRANLLMGVASNRVDVKVAAARAERAIERLAEPLSALYRPTAEWPESYLDLAWKLLLRNAAHDSVCACSVDEVTEAVLHRYAEARQLGDGLAAQALRALALSMADAGTVVVNPSAHDRGGMVEVVVPAEGTPGPDVQILSEASVLPGTAVLDGQTVRNMLGLIQGTRIAEDAYITAVTVAEDATGLDISVTVGSNPRHGVPVEEVKRELFTRLTARPDTEVRLHVDQPPVRRLLARQGAVPGFGWSRFDPEPLAHPVSVDEAADGQVVANGLVMANGLVTVAVDAGSGTFSLDGRPGYGRLVDDGDFGDTYNYSPPRHDQVVDVPDAVTLRVMERGPVRALVEVTATYTWPERVDEASSTRVGSVAVDVVTAIEVRANEPIVRVRTSFTNPARDHRLRVHLPLPRPAASSHAECAFAVVERGLTAEGRPEETPTPTFPSRRFVTSGGLTVVHEGLLEYELVDVADDVDVVDSGADPGTASRQGPVARTLALTLIRATGMLSRLGMTTRPFPAGPLVAVDGPQLVGPVEARYALVAGDDVEDAYRAADDVLLPVATAASFGGGSRPGRGTELTVRGAEVSSLRREAGQLELRVFNPRPEPTEVEVPDRSGWLVDLRGRAHLPFEGRFTLGGYAIATARLAGD